jgi:hypothetical protein
VNLYDAHASRPVRNVTTTGLKSGDSIVSLIHHSALYLLIYQLSTPTLFSYIVGRWTASCLASNTANTALPIAKDV